ncbi:MAG: aminotransferase class V-fold PLP-dependent enzyme [Collinsella sp.]
MDLKAQAAKGSMLNTPNTFGIYVCGKVFVGRGDRRTCRHGRAQLGQGQPALRPARAQQLFHGTTQADSRSIANVTFRTGDAELDAAFVAGAAEHQIQNVKGHRLVGGMRASVYNAVTMEDVQALATYMKDFEAQHSLSRDLTSPQRAGRPATSNHLF